MKSSGTSLTVVQKQSVVSIHVNTKFTPKKMKKEHHYTFCNSPHCHEVMHLFRMTDVTSSIVREI